MSEDDDRMLRYNTQIMAIYSDREFHRKKMEELEEQRLKIVRAKQMYCRLSGGHEVIIQIESCMYGESYRVCKRCELDLN